MFSFFCFLIDMVLEICWRLLYVKFQGVYSGGFIVVGRGGS